jgi:hypothetical protein
MTPLHIVFVVAGTVLPIIVAAHVFLSRELVYPRWAKLVWTVAGIMGLFWGALDWILLHWRYRLTREVYYELVEIRGTLWGIIIGFVIIFVIARPYQKRLSEKPEKHVAHAA